MVSVFPQSYKVHILIFCNFLSLCYLQILCSTFSLLNIGVFITVIHIDGMQNRIVAKFIQSFFYSIRSIIAIINYSSYFLVSNLWQKLTLF